MRHGRRWSDGRIGRLRFVNVLRLSASAARSRGGITRSNKGVNQSRGDPAAALMGPLATSPGRTGNASELVRHSDGSRLKIRELSKGASAGAVELTAEHASLERSVVCVRQEQDREGS